MSRERSELNDTEKTATHWLDGRRQKKGAASCSSKARELLRCFRFILKRSKRGLRHPF